VKASALISGGFSFNAFDAARTYQRAKSVRALWENQSMKHHFDVSTTFYQR
jgi:hypothetical protein